MSKTNGHAVALALPLFEGEHAANEEPAWLREVYVALSIEQARALERWARPAGLRRAQVVRALVGALLTADWPAPPPSRSSAEALETELRRALRRAAGP